MFRLGFCPQGISMLQGGYFGAKLTGRPGRTSGSLHPPTSQHVYGNVLKSRGKIKANSKS